MLFSFDRLITIKYAIIKMEVISIPELENYISLLRSKSRSESTTKQSKRIIQNYMQRFGSSEVSKKEVYIYYKELENKLAKSTFYNHIKILRLVSNENPHINNPFVRFKARAPVRKFVRVLYQQEIDTLYAQMLENNRISDYQRFLFEFIYATGMKPSEMQRLMLSDFDFIAGSIIVTGDNASSRYTFYSENLEPLLLTHLEKRQSILEEQDLYHSAFFIDWKTGLTVNRHIIYQAITAIGKELNMKLTPSILRHSFAVALLENGCNIRYIQALLGHASISTTQIYENVEIKSKQNTIQKYHPRGEKIIERRENSVL